jgi:hypothetical protein
LPGCSERACYPSSEIWWWFSAPVQLACVVNVCERHIRKYLKVNSSDL